jgi:hypothetical protein
MSHQQQYQKQYQQQSQQHIISFSGRKHSGKTELANICVSQNYKLINFADSMKFLICNALNISKDFLEEFKDTKVEYKNRYILTNKLEYIAKEIEIDEKIVKSFLSEPFYSIRSILQIIGTNLIREYNPRWHINRIEKIILENPTQNFCIGDTRFLDEKKMVEYLGGECWFIIRPDMFEISNHFSEINLKWSDFNHNIIFNNVSKEIFNKRWYNYMVYDNIKKQTLTTFDKTSLRSVINHMLKTYSTRVLATYLDISHYQLIWHLNHLMIYMYKYEKNIDLTTFTTITKKNAYLSGVLSHYKSHSIVNSDKIFKEYLKTNNISITNPFIIENLKLWDFNKVPILISENTEMIKHWIIGLMDLHSIVTSTEIIIYASKEIVFFIYNLLHYGNIKQSNDDFYIVFTNTDKSNFTEWIGVVADFSLIMELQV